MNAPILSILMPNFNHARFLQERISSLLRAMPENAELIIVDDASTDKSVAMITQFASQDARIQFHKNSHNLGVNKSVNTIVPFAKGKYIAFLGVDDITYPAFFTKCIDALEQHPSIGLCGTNASYLYDSDENITPIPIINGIHQPVAFPANTIIPVFKTTNFNVGGCTTILRRDLLNKYGSLDERLGPYSDWMLLHTIALKEGAIYIPEVLSVFRCHQTNYSKISKKRMHFYVQALLDIIDDEFKDLKPLFRRSTILRIFLKPCLLWVMFHPKYWTYLPPMTIRYLLKPFRKAMDLLGRKPRFL